MGRTQNHDWLHIGRRGLSARDPQVPSSRIHPPPADGRPSQILLPADFHSRTEVRDALRDYDFGSYFRAARAYLDLPQAHFGELVDIPQSRISKIENGRTRLRDITAIGRVLRTRGTPTELLGPPGHWRPGSR